MQPVQTMSKKNELIAGVLIGSLCGVALGAVVTTVIEHLVVNGFRNAWNRVVLRQKEFDPRWLLQ